MNDTKQWYQSKAVWGGLIAVAAGVVGAFFHTTISAADQSQLADAIMAIVSALGGIYAVYGRIVADSKIGSK
jgi:branched-subunit amino acid ABC-type transport system permease component